MRSIVVKYRPLDYIWMAVDRAYVSIITLCANFLRKSTFQLLVNIGMVNGAQLKRLENCVESSKLEDDSHYKELEEELEIEDDTARYMLHFLSNSAKLYRAVLTEANRRSSLPVEWSNEETTENLMYLWKLNTEYEFRPAGDWVLLGFQRSNDPTTDFRATGTFGLEQMVFFIKHHRIVLEREVLWPEALPFALTSIHMTAFLLSLLKDGHLKAHFYSAQELPSIDGLHKIHCRLLWLMETYWMRKCAANIMQFERHFSEFQQAIVRILAVHVRHLNDITVEDITKA